MRQTDLRTATRVAVLAGLCVGLAATGPARVADAQPPAGTHRRSEAPTADARRGQVLATFEGGQITVGDLEDAIAVKAPRERARLRRDRAARVGLLEDMIEYDLLAREAERRGYGDHPRVRHRVLRALSDALTRSELAVAPEDVPEAEVVALYEARHDAFHAPAQRRASVIVVATQDEARALIAELKGASRARFQAAASEHNDDLGLRAQGGELGYFDAQGRRAKRGAPWEVPQTFVREAFRLEPGAISAAPFPCEGGHALLFVTAVRPAVHREFGDVEAELRATLAEQAQIAATEALAERLFEAHPKAQNLDALDAIRLDPIPRGVRPRGAPIAPPDPRAPLVAVEPDGV